MPTEILNKLPKRAKALWESAYKAAKAQYGEERAAKIAWGVVKKKFKKIETTWIARFKNTPDYVTTTYIMEATNDSVARSIDGMIYRDFVLTSNKDFSDFALKRITEQINEEGVVGRVDTVHDLYHKLHRDKTLSEDEIEEELQKVNSGVKAIKALYKDGKVVTTIQMTPEAYAKAKDYNGASIEARMPKASLRDGVYNQARLTGFVLTDTPDNPDAVAVS